MEMMIKSHKFFIKSLAIILSLAYILYEYTKGGEVYGC